MGRRHAVRRAEAWTGSPDARAAITNARAGRCARAFRNLMVMRGDEGGYGQKYEKAYTAAALIYDQLCNKSGRKNARGGYKYDISALQGAKRRKRRR